MTTITTTASSATALSTRFRYTERTIDRSKFVGQLCASIYSPASAYRQGDTPWAALKSVDFDFSLEGLAIEVLVYCSGNRILTEQPRVSNDPLYRREGEQIKVWIHRILDRVNGVEVVIPGRFFAAEQILDLHNALRPSTRSGVTPDFTSRNIAQLKGEEVPASPEALILKNDRPPVDVGVRSDWGPVSKRPTGAPARPMPKLAIVEEVEELAIVEEVEELSIVEEVEELSIVEEVEELSIVEEVIEVIMPTPPEPVRTVFSIALKVATIAPSYAELKVFYKETFKVAAPNVKEGHLRSIVIARLFAGL